MSRLSEFPAYSRLDLPVVGAQGCELLLEDGRRILDLYGGHCVNTLGAGDSGLDEALSAQWRSNSFVTNLLPHTVRVDFEAAMGAGLPELADDSWQYFCSNSGAEANENALKLAFAASDRREIVCYTGAFHGRTAGASALNDPPESTWPQAPFEVLRLPWGTTEGIGPQTAAVILEPIQSLAGVIDPPAGFLEALRDTCDRTGALLIFDEVQTGNGRLGSAWAAQYFGVTPDLITTAKGVAGGIPFGLTLARASSVAKVSGSILGSTFGGGPLAMAAASEVARRVAAPEFQTQLHEAAAVLATAVGHGPVQAVRGAGLLLGLELEAGVTARAVRDALLADDILTGTCRDPQILRLSPPLNLRVAQAQRLIEALDRVTQTA